MRKFFETMILAARLSQAIAVAAIVAIFSAPRCGAEVVYDNGPPNRLQGYFASTLNPNGWVTSATKIHVGNSGLSFNGLNWWGGYYPINGLPTTESFTLSVFNPNLSLVEARAIEGLSRQSTGYRIQSGSEGWYEYAYSGGFDRVDLSEGDYYVGLSNAESGNPDSYWFWECTSAAAIFEQRSYNAIDRFWSSSGNPLAFQATLSAVPEIDPAGMGSVLALVSGVLGLLERRRMKAA
jgi:hypothetical protein